VLAIGVESYFVEREKLIVECSNGLKLLSWPFCDAFIRESWMAKPKTESSKSDLRAGEQNTRFRLVNNYQRHKHCFSVMEYYHLSNIVVFHAWGLYEAPTSDTRLYAASSLKIPLGTSLALAFFVRCLSIYNKSILFHRKEAAHAVHHHIRSNLFLLSRWPTIKAGRFSALSRHT
jgi:hypothetical protein